MRLQWLVRAPTETCTWVDQQEKGRPSGWRQREAVGGIIFSCRDAGKNGGESMHKSSERDYTHAAGQVLTLNSRRLTATEMKRVAKALELLTSAVLEDLRQMIDGKLSEQG